MPGFDYDYERLRDSKYNVICTWLVNAYTKNELETMIKTAMPLFDSYRLFDESVLETIIDSL